MKRSIKHLHGRVQLNGASFRGAMTSVAKALADDPHHRLYSWDHSNLAWKRFLRGECDLNSVTLNLAFYLASWGMYRGSTELLFRDYKALVPVVSLLKQRFKPEWSDCLFAHQHPATLALELIDLTRDLREALRPKLIRPEIKDHNPEVSDILVSKILLNTLECVPAFDTEVRKGLSDLMPDFTGSAFRPPAISALAELATGNRALIEEGQRILIDGCGVNYPLTKILDLYLWIHGNSLVPAKLDRWGANFRVPSESLDP